MLAKRRLGAAALTLLTPQLVTNTANARQDSGEGFTQTGAGAQQRSVLDKLRGLPSLSPSDFGARGDGATDDAAAVRAALAALPAGGGVLLLEGLHAVSRPVDLSGKRISILGQGLRTGFLAIADMDALIVVDDAANTSTHRGRRLDCFRADGACRARWVVHLAASRGTIIGAAMRIENAVPHETFAGGANIRIGRTACIENLVESCEVTNGETAALRSTWNLLVEGSDNLVVGTKLKNAVVANVRDTSNGFNVYVGVHPYGFPRSCYPGYNFWVDGKTKLIGPVADSADLAGIRISGSNSSVVGGGALAPFGLTPGCAGVILDSDVGQCVVAGFDFPGAPAADVVRQSGRANASTIVRDNPGAAYTAGGLAALVAQLRDGTALGGHSRGLDAVDLQRMRMNPAQVASGAYAVIPGGRHNLASGSDSFAGGNGSQHTHNSGLAFGLDCRGSGARSVVLGAGGTDRGEFAAFAFGGGTVRTQADRNRRVLMLQGQRTGAGALRLTSGGGAVTAANSVAMPNSSAFLVHGRCLVRNMTTGGAGEFAFDGMVITRGADAASTRLAPGSPVAAAPGAATSDMAPVSVSLGADRVNGCLNVTVAIASGSDMWAALSVLETVELTA